MRLEDIRSPKDLKGMSFEQLNNLAGEIRQKLIDTVAKNGGHLASNLGVVELTLAIHRVFDLPRDKIVFDVGHQSYVHKMLTGRIGSFSTLREYGGLSGFPLRSESEYDCFETGHASTAISAALGLARARDYKDEKHHVVALVGDGALTGGMCYEALNDAGNSKTRLTVILNDNEMSIARNVGALSQYLSNLRASGKWQNAKQHARQLPDVPVVGKPLYALLHGTKHLLKSALVRDKDIGFFEALGFEYFGPIDGHDLQGLEKMLCRAKAFDGPCVIHVITKKGNGYDKAEERPETFHGTPPFYVETGNRIDLPDTPSCGHTMGETLAEMANNDSRVVTITAAMPLGTGLDHFAGLHPDRMIDVGIAEEHAVTMAAGLAAGGLRPYVAVYASFFQRCYDQMINDVCLQRLPVVFLLDRSGVGGEDGQTHHGLFDLASLLPVPGLTVLAPSDQSELSSMLRWTLTQNGPCAIRYPKKLPKGNPEDGSAFEPGVWTVAAEGNDGTVLAVGNAVPRMLKVRELLKARNGRTLRVINCRSLKPVDTDMLRQAAEGLFFTAEEHMSAGGFGACISRICAEQKLRQPEEYFAVPERFLPHGSHEQLMESIGLCPEQICEKIAGVMSE